MSDVPSTDRDDVFIRSDVSRVVTLLLSVFGHSELMDFTTCR